MKCAVEQLLPLHNGMSVATLTGEAKVLALDMFMAVRSRAVPPEALCGEELSECYGYSSEADDG